MEGDIELAKLKKTYRGKKAPKGYHFMPGGRLMKDSGHRKKKRKTKRRR